MVQCYFDRNSKTENNSVKKRFYASQGTMLFSSERQKTENTSVKNSVNRTQGALLTLTTIEWNQEYLPLQL